jgi:hypothetical protein
MLSVASIGIRNMQRTMELTARVPAVDHVHAFGRPVIALPRLRPDRLSSKRNLVSLKYLSGAHKLHCAGFLVHDDSVGVTLGMKRKSSS